MASPKLFPPEQWQQIKALFEEASLLAPGERAAVIAKAADSEVGREVAALLAMHDEAGEFLEPPTRALLAPGATLGPYEIVGHVGGGGMGDVYRARDPRLARSVAVKVLRDRLGDPSARGRFEREARAIAALSHSNVLAIYDVGEASGHAYLVTELLAGETLRQRLARKRPTIAEAIRFTIEIARGLAAAHAIGIVHRDLKPENIFVLADGTLKVLDFGLARTHGAPDESSSPGAIVGTLGYLAPEQARGGAISPATDLFALGAILFEMLTGERAFRGETPIDRLRAVLDHEPTAPSLLQPGIPPAVDRVVASLLAKDPKQRFESARDLVMILELPSPATPVVRRRRWPFVAVVALAAGVAAIAAVVLVVSRTPAPPPVAHPYPLTHSGHDRHPAISPDGKFLAFTSERDGRARIWIQQIDVGREAPLTAGSDRAPRFSPDGSQILFTRTTGTESALYRVALIGGEPRKIVDDASDGDWSPDGQEVAFLRSKRDGANADVVVAKADGSSERVLARVEGRMRRGRGVEQRVRWSPDGKQIAISGFRRNPGSPQAVTLVSADGRVQRDLATPNRVGLVSAVAWDGPDTLLYSQALSVSGNSVGSPARIVRHTISTGAITTLLWSLESSFVLDRWPNRGIVFDARSAQQNLREIGPDHSRPLSEGIATDRQPRLSPDGKHVIFTSNRGGTHLDVWIVDRATGESRRLTDHAADDWDPALTRDGKLVWSSNRSGPFEIWMANADGTSPRQVTHDGIDAENPTATADGAWVIYAAGGGPHPGVWRIRADGSDARLVVPEAILPEVSPDGNYVLFLANKSGPVIGVASLADDRILPFEIRLDVRDQSPTLLGRARWTRDGRAIAFVGQDDTGVTGIFQQDFADTGDTTATRKKLAGFESSRVVESFDIDASTIVLAESEPRFSIIAVTDLPR